MVLLEDFILPKFSLPACPAEYLDINVDEEKSQVCFLIKVPLKYEDMFLCRMRMCDSLFLSRLESQLLFPVQ